jgi:hypothetical protein
MIVATKVADEAFTRESAWELVGGLSRPSKMPGYAYGLPAKECKVGAKLVGIPGSVCNGCYALKGNYRFNNVQRVQYRRLESLSHPRWTEAMIFLMHSLDVRWFRWHDSGDLQSPSHLEKIATIAQAAPHVRFWLPTREKAFVYTYLKRHGSFPENLVVRLSAAMVDGPPPAGFPHTSTVVTSGWTCPAPEQNNECGTCRACWNPEVKNVSYRKH